MEKAAFKLVNYHFTKASLDFNIPKKANLNISFNPKGVFKVQEAEYSLMCNVVIECEETSAKVVEVSYIAIFSFENKVLPNEIPDYFDADSLAIIFPYIRAFVSTITLQSNMHPIVLPTVNLMGLSEKLKRNTDVVD